jgi:HSP20 family molecular chaperone IbpA
MGEKKKKQVITSQSKSESLDTIKQRIWICPTSESDCGCNDNGEEQERLYFELPGVKKENINLHVIKDQLKLIAGRTEKSEYYSEYGFGCEIEPEKVKATYQEGLLTVDVPMVCKDPFLGSTPIKIE